MFQFKSLALFAGVFGFALIFASVSANLVFWVEVVPVVMLTIYAGCFILGLHAPRNGGKGLLAFSVFGAFYSRRFLCPSTVSNLLLSTTLTAGGENHPLDDIFLRVILSEYIAFLFAVAASVIWVQAVQRDVLFTPNSGLLNKCGGASKVRHFTLRLWKRAGIAVTYACCITISFVVDTEDLVWNWFNASAFSGSILACFHTTGACRIWLASFGTLGALVFASGDEFLPTSLTDAILLRVSTDCSLNPYSFNTFINSQLVLLLCLIFASAMVSIWHKEHERSEQD